ncbi:dipeptidase [Prescottella subtropica]|uniref:dipeptidase n=1 Tax=Prescottella subtropica TaxID=2545757 RepID=UPI001386C473|nr:membrane dipeptidase [Prescottella subtropica]
MSDHTPEATNAAFDDAVVIDGCSVSATAWHERIEHSGATALQTVVTWPRDDLNQALNRIQSHRRIIRDEKRFDLVRTVDDIHRCKDEGRVGQILGAQSTDMLGRDASLVEVLHDAGLRVMQLAYNERNTVADGSLEASNAGLSHFGRELVHAMNETGMLIDLVDTGIASSLETIELSAKPCVFSRLNPRATALEQQRNLTDEQITACAAKGGVIGLIPYSPLCATTPGQRPSIDDYIRHIDYVVDLVGIDHVAIGTDSEATPGSVSPDLAMLMGRIGRMALGSDNSIGEIAAGMGLRKPRTTPMTYFEMAEALQHGNWGATGFENVAKLPNLATTLTDAGWSDDDLRKLLGGNLLRVYAANWS